MSETIPTILPIPIFKDNIVWLLESDPGHAILFDPGDCDPVIEALQQRHRVPTHILITHHHHDHTDGVLSLARHFGAKIVGHTLDAGRLPPLDIALKDGDSLQLGPWTCTVMATPGHTSGHVVYRIHDALITGDTLFSLGCGRLFEGTPEQMWTSLQKIREWSGIRRLFPAHEYTLLNLGFVARYDPDNPHLGAMREWLFQQTDLGLPTLPTTLERECQCNPFLRADDVDFGRQLGLTGKSAVEVFAHIRTMRNQF
ncbi:MAG: hydroxyacylglutathione hydrolase [Magnetococcales bacterium]|nr:hydroxyacylglutathione hydrolase [Magnetococcales bacterium]